MALLVPPYFDYLIEAFRRGEGGRFVHLGHWDEPPAADAGLREGEFERAQSRLNDVLLEMATLANGQDVADIGCGFGGTVEHINDEYADMRLSGVNIDPRQLEICAPIAARNNNRLNWRRADACELPFADESLDRLLCIEAMFHFPSRRGFFAEAGRLLRPGGVLVASDIVLRRPPDDAAVPRFPLAGSLQDGFGPWPDPWGGEGDHEEMAADAGLHCDEIRDATASTLRSHRFTAPGDIDALADPGSAELRAQVALRWLHGSGYLRYLYMRFSKPL